MTFIVDATRDVVIYGRGFEPRAWTLDMLISAAIFALGFFTYRALRPAFADVL
jgi:ABC-type polysaccharide/polyol phosphate export permease